MASGQTSNYGLNQWAAEDPVLRTDFNQDNAKLDAALDHLANRFYYGTYTCDGTYGAENPITLTFPFQPKAVYLALMNRTEFPGGWMLYGQEQVYIRYGIGTGNGGFLNLLWNDTSMSFYSTENANTQFNSSGTVIYIAIQ